MNYTKSIIFVLISILFLLQGCQKITKYQCTNGSLVDDISLCPRVQNNTLQLNNEIPFDVNLTQTLYFDQNKELKVILEFKNNGNDTENLVIGNFAIVDENGNQYDIYGESRMNEGSYLPHSKKKLNLIYYIPEKFKKGTLYLEFGPWNQNKQPRKLVTIPVVLD